MQKSDRFITNRTRHIFWFKRDLRIHDNQPFTDAVKSGEILPLYIVEPDLWKLNDSSYRHWHFIHDSLNDLNYELKKRGAPLIIKIGSVIDVLNQLRQQVGPFTLWSHEETGNNWTYKRDKQVASWCSSHNVIWNEYPSNGIVRRLKTRDEWSKIRDQRMNDAISQTPVNINIITGITTQDLPEKNNAIFGSNQSGSVQKGGRTEAIRTLDSFLSGRARNYMQTISKPGISARNCSRLSTHLTYGTLSVREVENATKERIKSLATDHEPDAIYFKRNLSAFLSRLAWHCHFIQKLEQQPAIEHKCMHPAFEGMREPHFNKEFFEAWTTGNTGYPLIDACMRSLHENGWITFRMRAMLVSFASYHLWLDWRKTAPFLAKLFTDYEPGIHYSQFQMQSGVTGINAIRMYNPIKQSYEHDPTGKFIRRYVPELSDIPDSFIHEPWRIGTIPRNYQKPIIDHDTAIKHARAEISKRWKQNDFKELSKEINKKLGSRHRIKRKQNSGNQQDKKQLAFDI